MAEERVPFPRLKFSDVERQGLEDLLLSVDEDIKARKSVDALMRVTNGDAKKALSLIKDQYGIEMNVDNAYAALISQKKKPSLLVTPSQQEKPSIPSRKVKGVS